jgi:hypothetical protein
MQKLGGMKEANTIETTPKDSISNDNVVNSIYRFY